MPIPKADRLDLDPASGAAGRASLQPISSQEDITYKIRFLRLDALSALSCVTITTYVCIVEIMMTEGKFMAGGIRGRIPGEESGSDTRTFETGTAPCATLIPKRKFDNSSIDKLPCQVANSTHQS